MNKFLFYYNTPIYFLCIFVYSWTNHDILKEMTDLEQEKFITKLIDSVKFEIFVFNTLLYLFILIQIA